MFTTLTAPACADSSMDFFDGRPAVQAAAVAMCNTCPEAVACLMNAMEAEDGEPRAYRFGVYGGRTPDERYALDIASR